MGHDPGPFESIESAYDFLGVLSDVVVDAKQAIEASLQSESTMSVPRRVDALRLALYNLEKLQSHFRTSLRILNDLRSLRRLIFEERAGAQVQVGHQNAPSGGSTEDRKETENELVIAR